MVKQYKLNVISILGDPGAVSRVDKMSVVKVYCKIETSPGHLLLPNQFQRRLNCPLLIGQKKIFLANQRRGAAGWLWCFVALMFCCKIFFWPIRTGQFKRFWNWFGKSNCPGARFDLTVNFHHRHFIDPTNCPWVSEDVPRMTAALNKTSQTRTIVITTQSRARG